MYLVRYKEFSALSKGLMDLSKYPRKYPRELNVRQYLNGIRENVNKLINKTFPTKKVGKVALKHPDNLNLFKH